MLKRIGAEESGEFKAIATGTLPSGKPVIIKADGTVSVVAESTTSADTASSTFTTNEIKFFTSATYDSANDRIVIAYTDDTNNDYGTVIAGTVSSSDNSISFGTPKVFYTGYAREVAITYDSNAGKCVIGWYPWPNARGDAVVATVNPANNSISTGSVTSFESSLAVSSLTAVYAPDQQKVIFTYYANSVGRSIVGTVSGTSISFGSHVVYNNASTFNPTSGYDTTNNRLLVAFRDNGNSNYGTAMVGTVSGTSISFGSEYVWTSNSSSPYPSGGISHDTVNNKNVVFYKRDGSNAYARVITIDTSDNSISYGTEVEFRNYSVGSTGAVVFNEAAGKFDIINTDETDSYKAKLITGTVSGTDISFGTDTTIDTNSTEYFSGAYNSTLKNSFFAYSDETNNDGKAFVSQLTFTETNLTSENYIGMSRGFVSSTTFSAGFGSKNSIVGDANYMTAAYDSANDKLVIAYRDGNNSNYGTAVIGSISGSTVTFGTPVVFSSASQTFTETIYDSSSGKVVILFYKNDTAISAIVGTVSGTSISFGSIVSAGATPSQWYVSGAAVGSSKIVVAYRNNSDNYHGYGVVGTISGTSISFGSATEFENAAIEDVSVAYDSGNDKVVISYEDAGNSNYGTAVVGTVSGTSISFGSAATFDTNGGVADIGSAYDANAGKIVIVYEQTNGYAIVGTVSGTSISFGSSVLFQGSAIGTRPGVVYNSIEQKVYVHYSASSASQLTAGTVSGTSISFSYIGAVTGGSSSQRQSIAFISDQNALYNSFRDSSDDVAGTIYQLAYTASTRGQVTNGQRINRHHRFCIK